MSTGAGPLAGRRIVVTRPIDQAGPLVDAVRAAGGEAVVFPLLQIDPTDDPAPLAEAVRRLDDYALAVFVSPNAVAHALPALLAGGGWPAALQPAAVGPATAQALAEGGVAGCLTPAGRYDSESLLQLPELSAACVGGRRVVIFRGNGGRELLADTLRQRGALVDCVTCYRRQGPAQSPAGLWQQRAPDALVVSSSEALRHLVDGLDPAVRTQLAATPVFVPHARIAEQALACGLQRVVQTAATDQGLIEGLLAYNWPA